MSKELGRRAAESVWHVARRCLAIINRLQQGPATKQELLVTIYHAADPNAAPATLAKRFENDRRRLQEHLDIQVDYHKGHYVLGARERPLLNLSDTHVQTLGLLSDTFQPDSPNAPEIHQLIDQLVEWLPPDRQKRFRRFSSQQPTADLRLRDSEVIAPDVWAVVLKAWQDNRELKFDYRSSQHDDGLPREHHIQPWDLYFSDRGHWHLRGYCLFNDGPNGPWHPNDYVNYRVCRIVPGSAEVLPRKLPGVRPNGRPREVIFELAPAIARFGVSERKELHGEPKIISVDDGWVRVEGKTLDVFNLSRNLLYYGKNCRVLGGRELLAEMRKLVADLAEIYR